MVLVLIDFYLYAKSKLGGSSGMGGASSGMRIPSVSRSLNLISMHNKVSRSSFVRSLSIYTKKISRMVALHDNNFPAIVLNHLYRDSITT